MLLNTSQHKDIIELNKLENYLNEKIIHGKFNYYVNFSKDIGFSLSAENILFSDLIAGTFTLMHNLILFFPITIKEGVDALKYVRKPMFTDKECIQFNDTIVIHNLYIVDLVNNEVEEWIKKLPILKGMVIQDVILPDDYILNYSIIYWKHFSLFANKRI